MRKVHEEVTVGSFICSSWSQAVSPGSRSGPEKHPGLVPEKILAIINVKDCLDMNKHLIKSWSFCETFSKLQDSIIQTLYILSVGLQVNQGKIIN